MLSVKPGRSLHGKGHATARDAAGEKSLDLPFGRGTLSAALQWLELGDAEGRKFGLTFDAPAVVNMDGEARVVLAAERMVAGERRSVSLRLDLPADACFALAPASAPVPGNADQWFEWKADADASKPSAIDVSGWFDTPAGRRVRLDAAMSGRRVECVLPLPPGMTLERATEDGKPVQVSPSSGGGARLVLDGPGVSSVVLHYPSQRT